MIYRARCSQDSQMLVQRVLPLVVKDSPTTNSNSKKKRQYKGFDVNGRPPPPNTKLTDTQVKEVRWLSEYRGWHYKRLVSRYNVSDRVIIDVLGYVSRGRIHAKPNDFTDSYFEDQHTTPGST